MKALELIERLQECDPDSEVYLWYNDTYTDSVKHTIYVEPIDNPYDKPVVYIFNYWWDESSWTN